MWTRQSGQDSSAPTLLVEVRERLRTAIGGLEDRMGVRLWPGGKRGGDGDVEETEETQSEVDGQWRDDEGEGGSSGAGNKEKREDKKEDSSTSDDYSSMEGDDLRERALNRQKEEERNQTPRENKNGEDTGSASDGGQSAAEKESGEIKDRGSEEVELVNSSQEDAEKIGLCDVTAL